MTYGRMVGMENKKITTVHGLSEQQLIRPEEIEALESVAQAFSVSITPQILELIEQEGPSHPISKQFLPDTQELMITAAELADPIGDKAFSPVKGIVHRYPDRCLLKPVNVCPIYCRFCFRRDTLGSKSDAMSATDLAEAYAYIAAHPNIWEVILTGGDPLILKPHVLLKIIAELNDIPHVEVIRIHTRVPVVDSVRITDEMVKALGSKKALYVVLHANHPDELSDTAIEACNRLINAGIPMLSQTVLLKGINDNVDTLGKLMRTFVKNRIKPYYLHHGDLVRGTSHFRTTLQEGQGLMKALRGRYSGLCQPTYVLDIPGGYGKVPIGHAYCVENKIEDYEGQYHQYP